jgi:hypothetical protein
VELRRISAAAIATDQNSPTAAARLDIPDGRRYTRGQLGQLPVAQPVITLQPQRLLPEDYSRHPVEVQANNG